MIKRLSFPLLAVLFAFFLGFSYASSVSAQEFTPGEGLAGTPHDFTLANGTDNTEDVGLCTFCHTPHRAYQTRLLWNHTLSSNSFSWSDATQTMGGTELPTNIDTWSGTSRLCLSCHDGSVAIGDVAWYDESDHQSSGSGVLNDMQHGPDEIVTVGYGGDLKGNHPVAIPYPFDNAQNTYNGKTTGIGLVISEFVANPMTSGIRLFKDVAGDSLAANESESGTNFGIECSSCHDPHNKMTGSTVKGDWFLRGAPDGTDDYICTKCHAK